MSVTQTPKVIGLTVGPMQLIEVDILGLKPLKRGVSRLDQMMFVVSRTTSKIIDPFTWTTGLCRDNQIMAAATLFKPSTNILLGTSLCLCSWGYWVELRSI